MRRLALVSLLSLAAVSSAAAKGRPSLRVTLPADYQEGLRRGGFLIVRGYRHADPFPLTLTGFAEGYVNGAHRRFPLQFVRDTLESSILIVMKTWPEGGPWVLNIGGGYDSTRMFAGIVVGMGPHGVPVLTQVPRTAMGASRMATRREVTQLLAHLGGERARAPTMVDGSWRILFTRPGLFLWLLAALPLLYVAYAVQRHRRRGAPAPVLA